LVGGRIVVVWYQRHAAMSPASAEAKFSVVPSMVALPVPDILETWTTPFLRDRPDLTADWLEQARLTVDDKPLVTPTGVRSASPT
jgi:hypothetical protein